MALQGEEMNFQEIAITYMLNKAQADRSAALTSLATLLNHPAGIGDHSMRDLHDSLDESLTKLADADGRIETLQKYFLNSKPQEE